MERQYKMDILEMLGNYGHYVCNIGAAMDKAGINPKEIIEYIPPEKKMNLQNNT